MVDDQNMYRLWNTGHDKLKRVRIIYCHYYYNQMVTGKLVDKREKRKNAIDNRPPYITILNIMDVPN